MSRIDFANICVQEQTQVNRDELEHTHNTSPHEAWHKQKHVHFHGSHL